MPEKKPAAKKIVARRSRRPAVRSRWTHQLHVFADRSLDKAVARANDFLRESTDNRRSLYVPAMFQGGKWIVQIEEALPTGK